MNDGHAVGSVLTVRSVGTGLAGLAVRAGCAILAVHSVDSGLTLRTLGSLGSVRAVLAGCAIVAVGSVLAGLAVGSVVAVGAVCAVRSVDTCGAVCSVAEHHGLTDAGLLSERVERAEADDRTTDRTLLRGGRCVGDLPRRRNLRLAAGFDRLVLAASDESEYEQGREARVLDDAASHGLSPVSQHWLWLPLPGVFLDGGFRPLWPQKGSPQNQTSKKDA